MPFTVSRTRRGMSMYSLVVISPAKTKRPGGMSVSQATRLIGSLLSAASRTASEIWSAILSGWPSVTDSDVKRKLRPMRSPKDSDSSRLLGRRGPHHQRGGELVDRQPREHGADALGDRH